MRWLKKQIIRNEAGDPYLVRWAINLPWFGIKLHHILRSDEDRDCHDHPWSFLSIILLGGYWEHRPVRMVGEMGDEASRETTRRWHGPGSVLWRPAPSVHRLELPVERTAWSLVFTGPKRREWGFHTICGWIPWTRYWRAKEEGC